MRTNRHFISMRRIILCVMAASLGSAMNHLDLEEEYTQYFRKFVYDWEHDSRIDNHDGRHHEVMYERLYKKFRPYWMKIKENEMQLIEKNKRFKKWKDGYKREKHMFRALGYDLGKQNKKELSEKIISRMQDFEGLLKVLLAEARLRANQENNDGEIAEIIGCEVKDIISTLQGLKDRKDLLEKNHEIQQREFERLRKKIKALETGTQEPGASEGMEYDENTPNDFLGPITHAIMTDPVVAADGHTYEREAIEEWLKSKETSPLTNETLTHTNLVPNFTLKKIITTYNEKYKREKESRLSAN